MEVLRIVESNPKVVVKMNKYQEALNHFIEYDANLQDVDLLQELVDIYPEYLELKAKSTPKKPKVNHYDNDCTKIICPNDCGIQLNGLNKDNQIASFTHEHCPKCGQAIDWSKDD